MYLSCRVALGEVIWIFVRLFPEPIFPASISSQKADLFQQNKFYSEQNKFFPTARVDSGKTPEFARVF